MNFFNALRFLTIISLPWPRKVNPVELGSSIIYFPLVGMFIGILLAGIVWLFRMILPSEIINMIIIISLIIISGALHLDGLADTSDAIVGSKTVEKRWQIMHDSHVGGYGVVSVCVLLLTKYVVLNSIPENLILVTVMIMPVVSRWAMVYAIFAYPYARPSGLGLVFKKAANWRRFGIATVITLAVVFGLIGCLYNAFPYFMVLAVMIGTWIMVVILAAYLKRKFAGLSGDNYGMINEVADVFIIFFISMLSHNHWLV